MISPPPAVLAIMSVNRRAATVLIADDHAGWRDVIAGILSPEYVILGCVECGDDVVSRAIALQPDVITLDLSMSGRSGMKLLPDLRIALPHAVIVIVTTTRSQMFIDAAYERGANGYVLKNRALSDLAPAIQDARIN